MTSAQPSPSTPRFKAEVEALEAICLAQDVVLTRVLAYFERVAPGSLQAFTEPAREYCPADPRLLRRVNAEVGRLQALAVHVHAAVSAACAQADQAQETETPPDFPA